ncbi:MAG: TetR/AcrR family transcriptional regulator [bacterium]|nr:TetR/AcrR family transcriptional regulator [bacterium]MCM1376016.1 TetR/AcrR family transcriptional regulator [Muribaculum sp.]
MPRKESITIEQILDTAFEMTREEGFASVTARRVAARAGCSTQPIFRVYKNMEELWDAVYERAAIFFQDFYSQYPRMARTPFVNLGMAYIAFARKEGHLFELLFLSRRANRKSMYDLLNGTEGNVIYEINMAKTEGCMHPQDVFMRMWIFIHGSACMTLTGDYDLSDVETLSVLKQTYGRFAQ